MERITKLGLNLTPGLVPESELKEVQKEVSFLREFIGNITTERIKQLLSDSQQLAILQERLAQKDQQIAAIKQEADKRVKLATQSAQAMAEVEKRESLNKQRHNTQYTTVKPLQEENRKLKESKTLLESENKLLNSKMAEYEALLKSRDEEIERLKSIESKVESNGQKLDSIDGKVEIISGKLEIELSRLFDLLDSQDTSEEVKQQIQEVKDTIKLNKNIPTADDKDQIVDDIKKLISQGLNNKQIAERLMTESKFFSSLSSLSAAQQKVGRYIKSYGLR